MTTIEQPIDRIRNAQSAGWFPDPKRQHHLRYHDGRGWTEHVTHFGPAPCDGCRR